MPDAINALENDVEEVRSLEVSDENSARLTMIVSSLERQLDELRELAEEEETRYGRDDDDVSDDE